MFVQTEITPNPNALKFLPGKKVSNEGSFEITKKDETNNDLLNEVTPLLYKKLSALKKDVFNTYNINEDVETMIGSRTNANKTSIQSSLDGWMEAIKKIDPDANETKKRSTHNTPGNP